MKYVIHTQFSTAKGEIQDQSLENKTSDILLGVNLSENRGIRWKGIRKSVFKSP